MMQNFESLFKTDTDWHNNACLNYVDDTSGLYIRGYKFAADLLVEHIDRTGSGQDGLVFPIVFSYRHYIELLFKSIIFLGNRLIHDKATPPKTVHKIDHLWCDTKGIIREIWKGKDPDEFKLINHVICELTKVDSDSFAFRYPKDKYNQKNIPEIFHINVRHFKEMIDRAGLFLEGVECGIESYLENRQAEFK